jgi:hypothetical protein
MEEPSTCRNIVIPVYRQASPQGEGSADVHDLGGEGVAASTQAWTSTQSYRTAEDIQATSPLFGRLAVVWAGHGPCIEGGAEE